MRGNTLYNVSDPVNPQDVATKEYADKVGGDNPFFKENGNYKATHTINMASNKLLNLHKPTEPYDAATKDYVDYVLKTLKESLTNTINKRPHIIAVHARYCGPLSYGEYMFKFGGDNFGNCEETIEEYEDFKGSTTGFLMPHSGRVKKARIEILDFFPLMNCLKKLEYFLVKRKLMSLKRLLKVKIKIKYQQ